MDSFTIENLASFLKTFKNELSKTSALLILKQNTLSFEIDFLLNPTSSFLPYFIEVRKEKIYLEYDLEIRTQQWVDLLDIFEKNKRIILLENYHIEYGKLFDNLIDDIYFHQCASLLPFNLTAKFATVIKHFGELIKNPELKHYEFDFLILKSIFLRNYCRYFLKNIANRSEKQDKIDEAQRCISRAEKIYANNSILFIAKAHLIFYKATSDNALSEKEYQTYLDEIEILFKKAINTSQEATSCLALLQFYRNTYQFQKCCDLFLQYSQVENNKRRLLRYSYLIGESLLSLWERNWPQEYLDKLIKYTLEIHSESIDAGYTSPRIYLSKASLLAISGNELLSSNFIFKIFNADGTFSWDQVIAFSQIITEDAEESLSEQRVAVKKGINNGYFWNSLGTYAKLFLKDNNIAYEFYETARLLSSNNAVIYNNLAKVLIEIDINGYLNEIIQYLDKAERYSNRRFQWWKITAEQFEKICTDLEIETKKYSYNKRSKKEKVNKLDNLLEEFNDLTGELNFTKRGNSFENIMQKFIENLCPVSDFNYKIQYGTDGNFHQVDSLFSISLHSYLGEFYYSNSPAPKSEVSDLNMRLNYFPIETRGILFSFSGFDKACINYTKELIKDSHPIILIDGNEIFEILKYNCLKQILEYKVQHLTTLRNPYSKFVFNFSE